MKFFFSGRNRSKFMNELRSSVTTLERALVGEILTSITDPRADDIHEVVKGH
ncbi:hypothetical protein PCAR4_570117 [Paraburkholderia caribensis]|nr:hypothetical protein PCAR4_570117 [Paraburkholderia caribensis]